VAETGGFRSRGGAGAVGWLGVFTSHRDLVSCGGASASYEQLPEHATARGTRTWRVASIWFLRPRAPRGPTLHAIGSSRVLTHTVRVRTQVVASERITRWPCKGSCDDAPCRTGAGVQHDGGAGSASRAHAAFHAARIIKAVPTARFHSHRSAHDGGVG
jgi:hypothetical protein